MATKINSTTPAPGQNLWGKRMLVGALIAFTLIAAFLLLSIISGEGDPNWPNLWMIKPLVIVPLAGAMGGLFFHFMGFMRRQGGWKKIAVNVLSVVVFVFALWIGTVLGLNGTMWN